MATPEKDIERVQKNLDYVQDELLKRMNAFFGEANLGKNTDDLVKQLKEWKLNIQKENSELKKRQRLVELATKEEQERLNSLKTLNQQAKKPGVLGGFLQRIGFNENLSKDDLTAQYRARQRAGAIETIASGNLGAGLRQLGSTIPKIANFMGGSYYLAIKLVTSSLLKFDNALAKASASASSITGGLNSAYLGRGGLSMEFNAQMKNALYDLGMQKEYDNIRQALQKGYGFASYQGKQQDFISTMANAQKGLGAYGIDANSVNGLVANLRSIEGKNQQGVYASLQRLTDRFSSSKMFSPEQALQQATSLYDQTKHLGTNFEWASRAIKSFEIGLKNGTISLSDFAAVNRSLRGGGISQNAGIAEVVSDYAGRHGMNLPSSFLSSNAVGRGFAVSTRAMLGNNQFARAYQGQIQEMIDQMGMSSREERAGALQMILQSRGINLSPEMAKAAIKSNGNIDLIGTNIIGSGSFVKQEKEAQQAKEYENRVKKYYEGTTSWHNKVLDNLGQLVNNTAPQFAKGLSGEVTGDAPVREFIGFFANPGNWLPGLVKDTAKALADANQGMYNGGNLHGQKQTPSGQ